jgi:hypothetical protein
MTEQPTPFELAAFVGEDGKKTAVFSPCGSLVLPDQATREFDVMADQATAVADFWSAVGTEAEDHAFTSLTGGDLALLTQIREMAGDISITVEPDISDITRDIVRGALE